MSLTRKSANSKSWAFLMIGLLLLATVFVFLLLFFNRKVLNLPWWCALIASLAHTLIGITLPMAHLPYGWLMDAERILDSVFFIPSVKDTKKAKAF